nr:MAG TPA: hypothetical protein [Caudoviricetes sp.]
MTNIVLLYGNPIIDLHKLKLSLSQNKTIMRRRFFNKIGGGVFTY